MTLLELERPCVEDHSDIYLLIVTIIRAGHFEGLWIIGSGEMLSPFLSRAQSIKGSESMNVQEFVFVLRYTWLGAYCPIKVRIVGGGDGKMSF